MRYITRETFKAPPTAEVLSLIPAEIERSKQLIEQGLVETVYVAADQSGAWVVWNVDSQAILNETHGTLPLHPYMNTEITELAEGIYP